MDICCVWVTKLWDYLSMVGIFHKNCCWTRGEKLFIDFLMARGRSRSLDQRTKDNFIVNLSKYLLIQNLCLYRIPVKYPNRMMNCTIARKIFFLLTAARVETFNEIFSCVYDTNGYFSNDSDTLALSNESNFTKQQSSGNLFKFILWMDSLDGNQTGNLKINEFAWNCKTSNTFLEIHYDFDSNSCLRWIKKWNFNYFYISAVVQNDMKTM